MACPKTMDLINLIFYPGKLSQEATAEIRDHIEHCLACKAVTQRYQREKDATHKK